MSDDRPSFEFDLFANKLEEIRTVKQPRPLHRTFYQTIGSTSNRETERWTVRHSRKHRISCRSLDFNRVKVAVKHIRMRQSVATTVNHFLR